MTLGFPNRVGIATGGFGLKGELVALPPRAMTWSISGLMI